MINLLPQEDLAWRSSLDRKTINRLETDQQEPLASAISALGPQKKEYVFSLMYSL